jgi:hypothetical protein
VKSRVYAFHKICPKLTRKRLLGYARVSTYGQTLDGQLEQLRKAGYSNRNIYQEKVTGARADRRELNRMLGKLAAGRAGREGFALPTNIGRAFAMKLLGPETGETIMMYGGDLARRHREPPLSATRQ